MLLPMCQRKNSIECSYLVTYWRQNSCFFMILFPISSCNENDQPLLYYYNRQLSITVMQPLRQSAYKRERFKFAHSFGGDSPWLVDPTECCWACSEYHGGKHLMEHVISWQLGIKENRKGSVRSLIIPSRAHSHRSEDLQLDPTS